jgi:hypothetical protein
MRDFRRKRARIHGWRIDRFVHNYVDFDFYHSYVRVAIAPVNLSRRRFAWDVNCVSSIARSRPCPLQST